MVRLAGSSVSRNEYEPDEGWMRCYVHMLNNAMKSARDVIQKDPLLCRVATDFNAMKKIVADSNHAEWNSWLPHWYHLRQEVETRFGTYYLVFERFLNSSDAVRTILL